MWMMQKGRAPESLRHRVGMPKPAAAYGLLEVAKPIPMGQSDWPLRFDDAPPILGNWVKPRPPERGKRGYRSTEEHVPARRRAGWTGDVSG